MIVQAFRAKNPDYADRTANGFKSQFVKRGAVADIPETAGLAVWKRGHIGIYLGGGKVCESRGVAHGVVISDISTQKWTYFGKLRDVEYDDSYVMYKKEVKPESYIIYTVKKGDTLWAISRKYKTTVKELAKLNDLKNPSLIFVNQKIKIRQEEK
jgi:LysM repeat protein